MSSTSNGLSQMIYSILYINTYAKRGVVFLPGGRSTKIVGIRNEAFTRTVPLRLASGLFTNCFRC